MKKRLLAAALALTMSFSLVPAPAFAADVPAATTAPTGTPAPTKAPATPVTPQPTQAPAVTVTPAPTKAPAADGEKAGQTQGKANPDPTLDPATLNKALSVLNSTPTPAAAQPALLRTAMGASVNEAAPQPTAEFAFDDLQAKVTLTKDQNADLTVQIPINPENPESEKITETFARWRPDAANNSGTLTFTKYLHSKSLSSSTITLPELANITIDQDTTSCGDLSDDYLRRIEIVLTGSPTLTLQGGTQKRPLALYEITCSCSTVKVENGAVHLYSLSLDPASGNAPERPTLLIAEGASLDLKNLESNAILDVRGALTMTGIHYNVSSPRICFNTLQGKDGSVSVFPAPDIRIEQAGEHLPTVSVGTLGLDPAKPQEYSGWTFVYANEPTQTPPLFVPYEEYINLGNGKYWGVRTKVAKNKDTSKYEVILDLYSGGSNSVSFTSYLQNPGFKAEDHVYQKGTGTPLSFSHATHNNVQEYTATGLYKLTTRAESPKGDIYKPVGGYDEISQNLKDLVKIVKADSEATYTLPAEQLEALPCGTYAVPVYVVKLGSPSNIIMLRFQVADQRITVDADGNLTYDPASLGEGAVSYDKATNTLTINGSADPAKPLQVTKLTLPAGITVNTIGNAAVSEPLTLPANTTLAGTGTLTAQSVAAGTLTVNEGAALVAANGLTATGTITNNGTVAAQTGDIKAENITNYGQLTAATGSITAKRNIVNKGSGTLKAHANITAVNVESHDTAAMTAAAGNITATGSGVYAHGGTVSAGGNIEAQSSIMTYDGGQAAITAGGSIISKNSEVTSAAGNSITAGESITAKFIVSEKGSTLKAKNGDITAEFSIMACGLLEGDNITATRGSLVVEKGGSVSAKTNITAKRLANNGQMTAKNGSITATGADIQADPDQGIKYTPAISNQGTLTAGRSIIAETGSITAKEGSSVKATTGSITAKAITAEKGTELTAGDSLNITGTTGETPLLQLDKTANLATGKITVPKDVNESQIEAPGLSLALPGDGVDDTGILYPSTAGKPTYDSTKNEWTELPPVITDKKPTTYDKVWYTADENAKINYHMGDVLYGWFIAEKDTPVYAIYGSVAIAKVDQNGRTSEYQPLDPAAYTAREGSLIIDIDPQKLPGSYNTAGSYSVLVEYKGGSKTFPLTIVEGSRPKPVTPDSGSGSAPAPAQPLAAGTGYQTGDKANYGLPIGLALLCFAGMAACSVLLIKPRRKQGEEN